MKSVHTELGGNAYIYIYIAQMGVEVNAPSESQQSRNSTRKKGRRKK